jgi:5,10-methylenetetrahydromethanopterin reductase
MAIGPAFPELGYYGLPGHVPSPLPLTREVQLGEEMGFGSVWLSERLNTKNVEVLSGLAAVHAPSMGIASGLIANLPVRHPLVVASYASTMALLTDNRFALGIGRGQDAFSDNAGVARLTFRLFEDWIKILRALWRGESVTYSGPVGTLNGVSLGLKLDIPPPILMAVMGDKTAYWAGQYCDGVIYNSLWSPQAIAHSTRIVRQGAKDAGRDPGRIRVWAVTVTACELPEEDMLTFVVRRMNSYLAFPGMVESICGANGWDPAIAVKVRAFLREIEGQKATGMLGDENNSRDFDVIRRTYDLYPSHWVDEGCMVGTASLCADKMVDRFDAGADGLLLHGSTPEHLRTLLAEWSARRPAARFAGRHANPGL